MLLFAQAGYAFMNGLVFGTYGFLLRAQCAPPAQPTLVQIALAGAGSGIAAAVVTAPTDLVKIRRQVGDERGTLALAREIVRVQGPRALFRGLGVTALRDIGYGAYFAYVVLRFRARARAHAR